MEEHILENYQQKQFFPSYLKSTFLSPGTLKLVLNFHSIEAEILS